MAAGRLVLFALLGVPRICRVAFERPALATAVHVQEVPFFNYFRHNKSEPDLTADCIVTVFLNFLPNRFCFNMEPHELVCKSVTANLHRILVSIFKVVFRNLRYLKPSFHIFQILGP